MTLLFPLRVYLLGTETVRLEDGGAKTYVLSFLGLIKASDSVFNLFNRRVCYSDRAVEQDEYDKKKTQLINICLDVQKRNRDWYLTK